MGESQVETGTTLLEKIKSLIKQFVEIFKTILGEEDSLAITSVDDIPNLEDYTDSADIEIISKLKKIEVEIRKYDEKRKKAMANLQSQMDMQKMKNNELNKNVVYKKIKERE